MTGNYIKMSSQAPRSWINTIIDSSIISGMILLIIGSLLERKIWANDPKNIGVDYYQWDNHTMYC